MKRLNVIRVVLTLAVLLCVGLIGFYFVRQKMIANFFATMPQPTQTISATKVEAKTWTPGIDAIGTAKAANGVELAVETSGIIKQINFKPNQHVSEGTVLVQIDDTIERADLQDVQAAVKLGEASYERAKTLTSRGFGTEASYDEIVAKLATARSRQNRLQAIINQKGLKAPFSGVIGIPRIDVGQFVQTGTVVASFQDLDSMKVDFTVPEQMADAIKLGQEVRVGVNEKDLKFVGHVIGKDPRVDPQTRLVSAQALIENNKDRSIVPGQFLHVRAILPPEDNVITVPQTAVITSLYGNYIYVVEPKEVDGKKVLDKDGKQIDIVKQVFVKTGRRQSGVFEIISGVTPGQLVVMSGQNKLQAGAAVRIDNSIDITKLDASKLANGQ